MIKRPGEMSLAGDALNHDAWISFIGHIETPFKTREQCPRHGRKTREIARIRLKPAFRPGLKSLETCSHVIVFYWMHEADRTLIQQRPKFADAIHGTFALRSPHRPNPIAMSVADLLEVTEDGLLVRHMDCLDGTPLVDLKPYFPHTDSITDASSGWFDKLKSEENP